VSALLPSLSGMEIAYFLRNFMLSSVAFLGLRYLFTLTHKRDDFPKKKSLSTMYVFLFPLQCLSEIFLILRIIQRDTVINVHMSSCKLPAILVRF
jgi:hypothetical protein